MARVLARKMERTRDAATRICLTREKRHIIRRKKPKKPQKREAPMFESKTEMVATIVIVLYLISLFVVLLKELGIVSL